MKIISSDLHSLAGSRPAIAFTHVAKGWNTVKGAVAALVFATVAALSAHAAMYRCDGNVLTDHPVPGQNCVQLGASGAPKAAPTSTEVPQSPTGGPVVTQPSTASTPYQRPDPLPDWKPEPLKSSDLSALPTDERGQPILSQDGSGNSIVLEKHKSPSPSQALAICSSSVTKCHQPGQRSLDQCWVSMPRCASASGSDGKEVCCPSACAARYEKERIAGATPLEATHDALFGRPSCIPGVKGGVD